MLKIHVFREMVKINAVVHIQKSESDLYPSDIWECSFRVRNQDLAVAKELYGEREYLSTAAIEFVCFEMSVKNRPEWLPQDYSNRKLDIEE